MPTAQASDRRDGRAHLRIPSGGRLINLKSVTRPGEQDPYFVVRSFVDDYIANRDTMSANDVPSVAMLRMSPFVVGIVTSAPASVPESVPF